MKKFFTKDEYDKWQQEYKDQDKFAIYKNNKIIETIWLAGGRDEASKIVEDLNTNNSTDEFYYKLKHIIFIQKDNGYYMVEKMFDMFSEIKQIKFNIFIKIYNYIRYRLFDNLKYFVKNICFYIKNYNWIKQSSHGRTEWYSLIDHISEDIKFNVLKMIQNGCSYPERFKNIENWHNELKSFIMKFQAWEYYKDFCDDYSRNDYEKFGKEFIENYKTLESTIPYYKNSKDINYIEMLNLQNKYWDEICNWLKINGNDLWD